MTTVLGVLTWTALLALTGLAAWRGASARAQSLRRACHELRAPLTAARLGLELEGRKVPAGDREAPAGGGRKPPAGVDRLRAVELELQRAALVLEELGDLGELGWRPRLREQFDVRDLLADLVAVWEGFAGRHGAELELAGSCPRVLAYGDRSRVAQVVGNLISNAVEHGGGRVEVGCRPEAGAVRIEVRDEGAGLPAPVTELARRRRRRDEESRRGHGLAVALEVASACGGSLTAAPAQRGARLVLELPRGEAASVGAAHD